MQALLAPLRELAEYEEIRKLVYGKGALGAGKEAAQGFKGQSVALTGCVESQKLHMVYGLSEGFRHKVIVTYSDLRAKEIYEEYKFYDRNVMLYPAKDLIFFQADIHGNRLTSERIKVLRRITEGRPFTLVTTFAALMTPQAAWNVETDTVFINKRTAMEESALSKKLVAMGYEKSYQVENPGQFSVRGGIVDIFDVTEENPYRVELWGDEVESIRSFDVLSQRSIEQLSSVRIYPALEFVLSEKELKEGFAKIEADAAAQEKLFREKFQTEEAARIVSRIRELKEQVLEFQDMSGLEG
ncbi:MAG: transcription-repair coupling factor, partial [Lachnospiraceae bacterium]|nr:transcription-repair coupling factor [Lachnospiraceae bacterium]